VIVVKLWGKGFVKQVGSKQRVKERGVMGEQSGEAKEEDVTDEGIGESENAGLGAGLWHRHCRQRA